MSTGRLVSIALGAWMAAIAATVASTVVALLVAGRGMSRLDWVLPSLAGVVLLLFCGAIAIVSSSVFRAFAGTGARAGAIAAFVALCAATVVVLGVLILLSFNR